jgi:hypothetical protein
MHLPVTRCICQILHVQVALASNTLQHLHFRFQVLAIFQHSLFSCRNLHLHQSFNKRLSGRFLVEGVNQGIATPIIYYARVGLSFVGQVASHQNMTTIPNFGLAQEGIGRFVSAFTNGAWKQVTVRQAAQLAGEGIKIGGFFYVGEMIGKGSVIGYQIPGLLLLK